MGCGVDDSYVIVDSVGFRLKGTPRNQKTVVSLCLHNDEVRISVDDRDFQGSAAAWLGVFKC